MIFQIINVILLGLSLPSLAFRPMEDEYEDFDLDMGDYMFGGGTFDDYEDPFKALPGQINWDHEKEMVERADQLTSNVEKLISVLQSGDAEAYKSVCSENEVWHGDGLWNQRGLGRSCTEIIQSLKGLFQHNETIKVDKIAVIPNPRNNDIFLVGHFHMKGDNVLGVVRMVVGDDGKVTHTYFMSQPTQKTAKSMLTNPDRALKGRASLPDMKVLPYKGDDQTSHMISMWTQINHIWMMAAQDTLYGNEFVEAVDPDFQFISGLQVYETDLPPQGRNEFIEHMTDQHGTLEMEFVQISSAYSATHHVAVQHVNYLIMKSDEKMLKLAQGFEVAIFDEKDKLKQIWMFRQPFDAEERAHIFV